MGTSATEVERLIQAARLHLAQGELHEAAGRATEAIRLDAKHPVAYLVRAEAHRRLQRPERALADLAVAIRLDPQQPGPYVIRAEILKRRNMFDQAIADATYALTIDPRNAAAFSIRAECRNAIGDREGAREDVQEMLLIDPTRPVPDLRAGATASDPLSATAADDERFWKQSGGGNREDERALFADGKPVDKTYRSRQVVGDEDAPEVLGVASGYKPETIARPIPRTRSYRGRPDRHAPWALIVLGGAALFGMGLLWARRGQPTDRVPGKIEADAPVVVHAGSASRPEPVAAPAVPDRPPATLTPVPSPVREPSAPGGLGDESPSPSGGRPPKDTGLGAWQTTEPVEVMNWVSQDGVLTYAARGPSLMTRERYDDFDLHLEFLLPPKCNSGVFLRGRYEVQLIDPAFFPNGYHSPHVGNHGAIWGLIAPQQVVFSGPNKWNTLDVRMVGRNVTVRLNGVLIVDNKRVDRPTAGALDTNEGEPGPIVLQGQAVTGAKFRNISIAPLPAARATGGRPGSGPISPAVLRGGNEALSSLRGTWLAFTEETGGKRIPGAEMEKKRKTLRVEGDRFTLSTTYYRITGTIRHVPAEGDHAIDLVGKYVEGGNGKDPLLRAIFEIDRGTLRLCYSYNDESLHNGRPMQFETEEGRPGLCVTFRKVD